MRYLVTIPATLFLPLRWSFVHHKALMHCGTTLQSYLAQWHDLDRLAIIRHVGTPMGRCGVPKTRRGKDFCHSSSTRPASKRQIDAPAFAPNTREIPQHKVARRFSLGFSRAAGPASSTHCRRRERSEPRTTDKPPMVLTYLTRHKTRLQLFNGKHITPFFRSASQSCKMRKSLHCCFH